MMLKVDNTDVNLGKLEFGKAHSFKYILSNDTDKSIIINRLVMGCSSCTKAYTNKTYIKPGEKAEVNVTFTPGTKGKQLKSLDVIYNHVENLALKFTAEVD